MKFNEITFLNIMIIPGVTIILLSTGFIFGLVVKESQYKVQDSPIWVFRSATAGGALTITSSLFAYEAGKRKRNQNL